MENFQANVGHLCTRARCDAGEGEKLAFRWIPAHGGSTDISFNELDRASSAFAEGLRSLGLKKGDLLFTYLPKCPEQFYAILGALKLQLVCGTLFSNFGDEALLDRLGDAKARAVVTKKSLLKKLLRVREKLPHLEYIIIVDEENDLNKSLLSYDRLVASQPGMLVAEETSAQTPSLLHYTSGSTGKPKGVLHVHGSLAHQQQSCREVLQLQSDDLFWCTADQGWVTGTTYGVIGPWSLGISQIHFGGAFDSVRWFEILESERVTVWYSAPTALRMLMREPADLYASFDLSALRSIFSVGEPLNPEVIAWGRNILKRDIFDTWFQTETGGIMISNHPGLPIRPGSMGQPLQGIEAIILNDDGSPLGIGKQGNLCLKLGWSSMFVTYLNNPKVYAQKFRNGYYWTGDSAVVDVDGYLWFKGRSDDVINTAGHLVSPFEVESALLEIEGIAESGVIGVPDDLLFEKIIAFVVLKEGYEWSKAFAVRIRLHIGNRVSSIATPQEIIPVTRVPKNKSGKIMRRILKARYLGEDAGDLSTLDDA